MQTPLNIQENPTPNNDFTEVKKLFASFDNQSDLVSLLDDLLHRLVWAHCECATQVEQSMLVGDYDFLFFLKRAIETDAGLLTPLMTPEQRKKRFNEINPFIKKK